MCNFCQCSACGHYVREYSGLTRETTSYWDKPCLDGKAHVWRGICYRGNLGKPSEE
jgi:hypothetical protein